MSGPVDEMSGVSQPLLSLTQRCQSVCSRNQGDAKKSSTQPQVCSILLAKQQICVIRRSEFVLIGTSRRADGSGGCSKPVTGLGMPRVVSRDFMYFDSREGLKGQ